MPSFRSASFALVSLVALSLASDASATTKDTQPETRSNPVVATPEGAKAQLHSGGIGYTYQIDLPPAAGIVPELALSFSSLTGNTEYGKGWTLHLGKIERSTRVGPPAYQPPSVAPTAGGDRFELDGALVVQDPGNPNRFHLEQTDHRRILYVTQSDSWEVTTPDGTKFLYGSRPAAKSKLDNAGRPDLPPGTFRWSLDKVSDPRGNWYEIDYEYEIYAHPQPAGGPIDYNMNNHPDLIRYSYHASESGGRQRRIVDFQWGNRGEWYNDDRPTSYRSGFKIQISERLTNILVGTDTTGDGQIDQRARRYEFLYAPKPAWGGDEALPPFSQLVAIQRYGKTDADVFPSRTEFQYTRPLRGHHRGPGHWSESNRTVWRHPEDTQGVDFTLAGETTPAGTTSALLDMNGDGFVDHVSTVGTELWVAYGPVIDGGTLGDPDDWGFATPERWTPAPPMTNVTDRQGLEEGWLTPATTADLTDIDGDGLPDRVVSPDGEAGDWQVARNLGDGRFAPLVAWSPPCPPSSFPCPAPPPVGDPYAPQWQFAQDISMDQRVAFMPFDTIVSRLVDVNGDGRPDHVTGANGGQEFGQTPSEANRVWVAINNGGGFDQAVLMPLHDLSSGDGQNYLGANKAGFTWEMFADANGDGLADRFTESCLGRPVQQFSLGDGWQTPSRAGQGHYDYGQGADPDTLMCDSPLALYAIWPEAQEPYGTIGALLDLNGDGINDYFHSVHPARNGPCCPGPLDGTVWFGLGDGTYLMLTDHSEFPLETEIAPGVEWNMALRDPGAGRSVVRSRVVSLIDPAYSWSLSDTIDMNGDGLLDQIYFGWHDLPGEGSAEADYYFVWFHPGPEGLLEKVTNELGGVTKLTYQPSTWFRDNQAQAQTEEEGQPEDHPPSVVRASQPQWLLAGITVEDGRTPTQQAQSIEYAELLYDTESREYLGARMAEAKSKEGVNVLSRSRRFFHQTKALRPRLEFEEIEDASGKVVRTEKTTWVADPTRSESGSPMTGLSWFPEARKTLTKLRDPVTESTQSRIVSRTFDPSYGNLLTDTYWGADELLGTPDDFKTVFAFSPNYASWLVSYPRAITQYLGSTAERTEIRTYDGALSSLFQPQKGLVTQRLTTRGDRSLREKWNYDAFGNQTKYFDVRAVDKGSTTPTRETFYDSNFDVFPILIRNALLHGTQFAFETDFGEVAKVRDPNGYIRCWTYDAFGRLTALTDRGSYAANIGTSCNAALVDFEFPGVGVDVAQQHILETERHGSPVTDFRRRRFFDGLGRVYQEEQEQDVGTFAITVRGWGPRGEASCESLPFEGQEGTSTVCAALAGARIETQHDALLRPTQTQRVVGGTPTVEAERTYEIAQLDGRPGNELIETRRILANPSPDRVVRTGTDPQGRVVAVDEVGGGLTLLDRDAKGRIVAVDGPDVGSDLNQLFIGYNHLDQRTSLTGFWPASWSYQYDANGNLSQQTSPGGTTIRLHWDDLNRLALKDYAPDNTPASPGTEDVVYSYDTAPNGIGRLAFVETPTAEIPDPDLPGVDTSFSYLVRGFVQAKIRNFGGSAAYPFYYTYDRHGRRLTGVLPNGRTIAHSYDGSVLKEIRVPEPYPNPASIIATNVELHASGALEEIDYPLVSGGSSYGYEPDTHRLASIASASNGNPDLQGLGFGYDLAGNLRTVTDARSELSQDFTYDGLHRLATATSNSTQGYGALGFTYNAAGNLLTKGPLTLLYGGAGGPHGVTAVQSGASLVGSYAYDGDGGVVQRAKDGAATLDLVRDDDGRITSIPGVAGYAYDESGERSHKVGGGSDILYVDPEYEVDLASVTHNVHFFHGSRRVTTENRSGLGLPGQAGEHQSWQFYFPDFVGSNAVVVRDTGEVQRSFFRPFGEFAQEGGGLSPYLFTDQEHDPESDLQYFGARYYDPWIGRFLSQDPALLGSAAGVTFNRIATDGQQFNAYSYVGNRPTVFVDPSGEFGLLKSVVKLIAKGGDIAGAFSDVVDAKNTVTDPTASIGEKILAVAGAAASLVALGPSDLKVAGRVLGITDKGKDAKRATERRVRLRESTREQIEANQPRNSRGELIDPNTREPLKSDEIDVGHKTGQEWRRRREMHREAGSTRREVIQAENDPDLYQLEDRSSNRGHRFEQR